MTSRGILSIQKTAFDLNRKTLRDTDLHFDGVALFQRSIQQPWCVDDLPPQILVVCVTHKQGLGGEGIGLHIHICPRHLCRVESLISQHVKHYFRTR